MGAETSQQGMAKVIIIYDRVLGALLAFLPFALFFLVSEGRFPVEVSLIGVALTFAVIINEWWFYKSDFELHPTGSKPVVLFSILYVGGLLSLPALLMVSAVERPLPGLGLETPNLLWYAGMLGFLSLLDCFYEIAQWFSIPASEKGLRSHFTCWLFWDLYALPLYVIWGLLVFQLKIPVLGQAFLLIAVYTVEIAGWHLVVKRHIRS